MKNTLLDVHNMLVEEMEKLSDDELMEDEAVAKKETARAQAMAKIAHAVAFNIATALKSQKDSGQHVALDGTEMGRIVGATSGRKLELGEALG